MPQLADLRPAGLNFRFRPGSSYAIRITGPADWLSSRAFTATLGEDALSVTEDGDTLIVTVSEAITEGHPVSGGVVDWVLTQTGGNDVIVGKWEPSNNAAASTTTSLEVTFPTIELDATVVIGPGGSYAPAGPAGGVLSGTYPNPSFAADMATQAELNAEIALARNADNLTSGTVADARIASTIARDSEVTSAISALSSVYQPLDGDLTALASAGNSAVLAATTAAFTTADETKLDALPNAATLASTYVPKSTTLGVPGTRTTLFEVADPNQTNSKWREVYGTAIFQTDKEDPVAFFGWNADKALGGGDAAEPALYMGFEADYWDAPTKRTMEWYVQVMRADSSGTAFRPFAFTAARDSNADLSASVQIDIGDNSNGSSRSVFNVVAGATAIFTVTPTAVGMAKGLTISPAGGFLQVASGSIIVNSTATDAGHIFLRRRGVDRWYLANFDGDTAHYLWNVTNSRFHVKYTPGASDTAAITELQSSLKVNGNLGVFGTTATTKQTVTGSRGGNAALASLITALAAYGLVTDSSSA